MHLRMQAGRGLACALLEGLLTAREAGGGSAEERSFPYLVVRMAPHQHGIAMLSLDFHNTSSWHLLQKRVGGQTSGWCCVLLLA